MDHRYRVRNYRRESYPRNPASGMNRVTEGVVDITKVAVTGSVAMGLMAGAATLLKK